MGTCNSYNTKQAIESFKEAIGIIERQPQKSPELYQEHASCCGQIAFMYFKLERWDEVIKYFEASNKTLKDELHDVNGATYDNVLSLNYKFLSLAHEEKEQLKESFEAICKAIAHHKKLNKTQTKFFQDHNNDHLEVFNRIVIKYSDSLYDKICATWETELLNPLIKKCELAIAILKSLKLDTMEMKKYLASFYSNLTEAYKNLEDFQKANEHNNRADELWKQVPEENEDLPTDEEKFPTPTSLQPNEKLPESTTPTPNVEQKSSKAEPLPKKETNNGKLNFETLGQPMLEAMKSWGERSIVHNPPMPLPVLLPLRTQSKGLKLTFTHDTIAFADPTLSCRK